MTDGISVKTKHLDAKLFKFPPQPYMCIKDTLQGSSDPCYVNVLSWQEVPRFASKNIYLYGGMKVVSPRIEREVSVFAVIAHPQVFENHVKNIHDPAERECLINVCLDYVEKMNAGVVFSRRYEVLRDCSIIGELKQIWTVVQSYIDKNDENGIGETMNRQEENSQSQEQQQFSGQKGNSQSQEQQHFSGQKANSQSQEQQQFSQQKTHNSNQKLQLELQNKVECHHEQAQKEQKQCEPSVQKQPQKCNSEQKSQKNSKETARYSRDAEKNDEFSRSAKIFREHHPKKHHETEVQPLMYSTHTTYLFDGKKIEDGRWQYRQMANITRCPKMKIDVYAPLPKPMNAIITPHFWGNNNRPINDPPTPFAFFEFNTPLRPYVPGLMIDVDQPFDPPNMCPGHLYPLSRPLLEWIGWGGCYYPPQCMFMNRTPEEAERMRTMHLWKKDSSYINCTFYQVPSNCRTNHPKTFSPETSETYRDTNGTMDGLSRSKSRTSTKIEGTTSKNTVESFPSGNRMDTSEDKKTNGHILRNPGKTKECDGIKVYTILKKPQASTSQECLVNEISQLSLNDSSNSVETSNKSMDKNKVIRIRSLAPCARAKRRLKYRRRLNDSKIRIMYANNV